MTNINKLFACLAASLAIVLPVPGRIAFGIFVLVHFNLLVVLTTLLIHAIRLLKLESLRIGIIALEIIGFTVLYMQFLNVLCPLAAFTLGFAIYLPSISAVILSIISSSSFATKQEDIASKLTESLTISGFCLIVFILRDVFGYSTFTIPAWKDIYIIHIPVLFKSVSFTSFFATVPGGLVLTVLVILGWIKLNEKEEGQEENND